MLDLYAQQEMLEKNIHLEAIARANKESTESNSRFDWSSSRIGATFVKSVMNQLDTEDNNAYVTSVRDFISSNINRKAAPNLLAARLLAESGLSAEVLAYISTKTILNFAFQSRSLKRSSLSMYIGRTIDMEVSIARFSSTKERKNLLKKLFKDFDKRTYPKAWRVRTIKNYFDAEQVDWRQWEPKQHLIIGFALLALFRNSTGLIDYSSNGTMVELSGMLESKVMEMLKKDSRAFTLYRPMVIPPRKWSDTNLFKGGYLTGNVSRTPFIKGSGKRDVERLVKLDLSKAMRSINALQETPWRVNKRMLEAQKWVYHVHGGNVGSITSSDEEPMPPLPEDYETNPEVKKAHNRALFEVHDRRRRAKSKRIGVLVTHAIADEMKEYERIYFPHNLCSRGRAYPIPAFLNPQGPDYVKALLEFAEGKPIENYEQLDWLYIAGANAYGNDKVSLQERSDWVRDNLEMIFSVADNYETDHRWMKASDPYQFLRFCFEVRDYMNTGFGFLSHMVIPVDATNSGLQHYSAMLRDEVGGRSVNLVPGLSRQDVYGDVAHRVIEFLMEDGTEVAKDWITFGIDRKLTKRQVMVVPYAGKFSSCLTYTREAVDEKLASGVQASWGSDIKEYNDRTIYLAKLIWKAIDETVVKGKIAMTFLSKVAGEYAKTMNASGIPLYERRMSWLTPDGFEVVHFRQDEEMHRVKTTFEGSIFLSYYRENGKLNTKDMALACPPNFVHALDATHLRMTINKALDIGITDFGMVHDSFGTHAAAMSRFLKECVKPAFVEMYTEHDVIGEFAERYKEQSLSLPIPEKGTLDLQGVLSSEFFFS